MRRFIAQPVLVALALALPVMVLGGGEPAAAVVIDFERDIPADMSAMHYANGLAVPQGAQLGTQLRDSHGVTFSSISQIDNRTMTGYVALVNLANAAFPHAPSGSNGIGAVDGGQLQYGASIVIRFTMPGDPATAAITDFVSITGDLSGNGASATMEAFDVNGASLGMTTVVDNGGLVLRLPKLNGPPIPNIHYVVIRQTQADIAFDDLKFNPLSSPQLGQAPVARIAPVKAIHAGQTVMLDGTGSDDDDTATDKLIFEWTLTTKPDRSSASLSAANTMTPSFLADVPGDYAVELTVTDARGLRSAPARVTISSGNTAPMAEAGDDKGAFVGALVSLDGSASADPDGDGLGFSWTLAKPEGSAAALTAHMTATPAFTADVPGTYVATLTVTDPFGAAATDDVTISVVRAGNFAQEQLVRALNALSKLMPAEVTTRGNQNAMQQHLTQVIAALQAGDMAQAADKLLKVMDRTDGCARWGAPDGDGEGRDWIVACGAQTRVYPLLMSALEAMMR
jgi:PKD domain